ncbi:ABC transporter substrate-binding protein [Nonomuraea gerenzanensis]|uniref:Oligopeptide ABC transporter, periplasmic oligopeptide-binding protein OppA (TC 3.A.1.5.1) n=1 Tax=Nonomuraea gerenzanensis TaxID=93944 RepID=A0A1M4EMT7_9ACTN|nr:ABC transporter substrate-binding protein [Nonomuraea gerenzanensis]UBU11642.1 ABC transporter substrate-binding protein [Nonomuraea gerenzanensis]SBP00138.1 Oligopeptide ABC transporter, periplasmic oligopeptide-binding protein OppA (TC 3.A.1.5.1) [Nonomuraea gerenzanensis]
MRWHKRLLVAGVAGVLALTASACAGGQVRGAGGTPQPQASSGSPAGQTGGQANDSTFVYAPNSDVVTDWDPATSYSNEIVALANIYEGLTRYNSQTKQAEPRLATEWTSSDDGKEWTFKLRQGVKFHTGDPMDAEAAKQAIERTIGKKGGAAYIWDPVDRIEAVDASTLKFTLKYAAPLDLVTSSGYAAWIYDVDAVDADGKTTAGTGPYTIDSWKKGEENELTLKAFEDYWGGWKPEQYKKVTFRVTPEITTAWQLVQKGEVNFVRRLNPQLFEQAGMTQGVQTAQAQSFQNLLVLFNTAAGPTKDVKVRQALQLAIDYDGLAAALEGSGVKASGLVPQGLIGHVNGMEPKQDLPKAQQLLAEAGYGPDLEELELSLTYATGDEDQKLLVTLLSSTLKQLNVTLRAKPMSWSAQWDLGKKGGQDVFVMYWYPDYPDAYSWFLNVFKSADKPQFNLSYLKNAEIDAAIDKLPELTATDKLAAEQEYQRLQQKIIQEEAAVAVPYVQRYQRALSADVQGYQDNPAYPSVVFFYDLTRAG